LKTATSHVPSLCTRPTSSAREDVEGKVVDYFAAVEGGLQIEPDGAGREALATDYAKMLEDQVMVGDALPFDELMKACAKLAQQANDAAKEQTA